MDRISWLLFLHRFPLLFAYLPQIPGDVESFNHLKSQLITEILGKELSENKCRLSFGEEILPDLYFHHDTTAVRLQNLRIPSPKCMDAESVEMDVFGSRMDANLTFPSVNLAGYVTFHEDVITPERQPFRVEIRNLSGSGVCFMEWTETGYRIIGCDIRFESYVGERGKMQMFGHGYPVEENVFLSASVGKTWTALTNAMNRNVARAVNTLLRKLDVLRYLRDPGIFQKYRNYVIESTESANEFVDGIMASVRKMVVEKYNDSFAIPDINESFQRKGLLVTWRGSFIADHGFVHGLSTVSRIGDTTFATDNASQTHFFGNLSFEHLDLHYDRYRAEFMSIGPSGTLNTRLRPIRLHIHPYVNFATGKIYLEDFEIEEVGELLVEVTGLGTIFNWVASKITTWVAGLARDRILTNLQEKYDAYIKSILSGYTVEDITSGKAFDGP